MGGVEIPSHMDQSTLLIFSASTLADKIITAMFYINPRSPSTQLKMPPLSIASRNLSRQDCPSYCISSLASISYEFSEPKLVPHPGCQRPSRQLSRLSSPSQPIPEAINCPAVSARPQIIQAQ